MPLQSFLFQRLTRIFFLRYCSNYISSTSVCIYLHRLDLKRTWFLTFTLFVMLIKWTNVSGLPMTKIRIFNSKPRFAYCIDKDLEEWIKRQVFKYQSLTKSLFFVLIYQLTLKWFNDGIKRCIFINNFHPFVRTV